MSRSEAFSFGIMLTTDYFLSRVDDASYGGGLIIWLMDGKEGEGTLGTQTDNWLVAGFL